VIGLGGRCLDPQPWRLALDRLRRERDGRHGVRSGWRACRRQARPRASSR
jgi:hypothetical protein